MFPNYWIHDMCKIQLYHKFASASLECKQLVAEQIGEFAKNYGMKFDEAEKIAASDEMFVGPFIEAQTKKQYEGLLIKKGTIVKKIKGKLTFTSTELDVTDPCYTEDTWCRITVPIEPGTYNYEVRLSYQGDWGIRVKAIRIFKEGSKGLRLSKYYTGNKEDNPTGEVGVDSGMAGFFEKKPDYDRDGEVDEWHILCNYEKKHNLYADEDNYPLVVEGHKDTPVRCEGIYSTSGYGDGTYYVKTLVDEDKKVCGYELKFC